ncbi:hypothetical protein LTR53_011281 [Teratosphaeriaceae sp. CCFEE 6253]|nr:hypothetical protein LTR53_011281 [Teratosphaeriaceae sp. CCFEE 6253]
MATKAGHPPWPRPNEGDFIINDFPFSSGESLPELRLHYRTLGTPKRDKDGHALNAVLILHGTTGSSADFFRDIFAGELFGPGQLLSAQVYFLVLPDGIGHGGSSKPSDGLKARFPRYRYHDMVRAQHRLLTQHLDVDRLRLVMGTSMGGMHTWMWGTLFPDMMDALMPLASLPVEIAGRNRMMRKLAIDSIRQDPAFHDGEYEVQPTGLRAALGVSAWMGSTPLKWQQDAPDRASADAFIDAMVAKGMREKDANDFAYAFEASLDYDPQPGLAGIQACLTAINFADDQVNPPELGILEEETRRVPRGVAIVMPIDGTTAGHGTHSMAAVWNQYLAQLLDRSAPGASPHL